MNNNRRAARVMIPAILILAVLHYVGGPLLMVCGICAFQFWIIGELHAARKYSDAYARGRDEAFAEMRARFTRLAVRLNKYRRAARNRSEILYSVIAAQEDIVRFVYDNAGRRLRSVIINGDRFIREDIANDYTPPKHEGQGTPQDDGDDWFDRHAELEVDE